jgi:hypothetical protein
MRSTNLQIWIKRQKENKQIRNKAVQDLYFNAIYVLFYNANNMSQFM